MLTLTNSLTRSSSYDVFWNGKPVGYITRTRRRWVATLGKSDEFEHTNLKILKADLTTFLIRSERARRRKP